MAALAARTIAARLQTIVCAPDPFLDPKTDPCNPLEYIANNTLTAVAFALYVAVAAVHSYNMWFRGARWMAAMVIGAWTFSTGIALRFGLHSQPDNKGIYIAEYLLVVLSPCAFIAADYVLLGRMARYLNTGQLLAISPRRITVVFVTSDIVTFLIQAVGGSVSIASNDIKTNETGSNIFLAGLVLQLVSFLVFTCVYLLFLYRVYRFVPQAWTSDSAKPWFKDWRMLALALFISCVGILVRSTYRTIELSQGFKGPLATNEGLFYGLDTYPLFVAISVYVPFWPGQFIPPMVDEKKPTTEEVVVDDKEEPKQSLGTASV